MRGSLPAILLFIVCSGIGVDAQLRAVETPELRLVYVDPGESFLVPHAVRTFLNSYAFQRRLFTLDDPQRVTVLLVDFQDAGNAGATVVPYDALTVQIAPLNFAFETIAGNDRLNIIMNHELVHVATMDRAAPRDRLFRRLFGGKVMPLAEQPESMLYFFLTTPRVAAPRWYHEGIAVFVDTWMAGGLGRAQGGYDEMVFRSMVRDGVDFYDPLGLVSEGTRVDFQVEVNSYLYGTRFMTWLARKYSPERLVDWVSRGRGSRGYYSADFRRVFGTSLNDAWASWIEDERAFQARNLAAIRQYPVTRAVDITPRALGSVSRAFYDAARGKIYAAFNYPGAASHVGAIDVASGRVDRIVDIKGPSIYTVTSLAYDPDTQTIFYTADNGAWRDLMRVDAATGRSRMLLKDARIGDLAFNRADRSIWGIRHLNGICSLVRVRAPYTEWERVMSWPYGTVVYDLDLSPDGSRLAASFGTISGKQEVQVLATAALLAGGDAARDADAARRPPDPIARFDFGSSVPNGFVFSPDGRYLYGSSYYTGASNIFRYDLELSKLDAVTNAETGFFRPIPLGGDSLIAFRYSGQGFVPARLEARPLEDVSAITFLGERLAEEHPIVKQWMVGSPAAIPFDDAKAGGREYKLAGGLRRESMYPVVQGYKDSAAIGYRVNFSDPLQLNHLAIAAAYSPAGSSAASERLHLDAEYRRYDWRGRVRWNGADFYDLFGPTKTSRKGYMVEGGHLSTLVFDEPRRMELDVSATAAGGLDRLPEFQNVVVDVDRLAAVEAKLTYSNQRHSLGYVDEEKGRKWSALARTDYVDGTVVPKLLGAYDQGAALPIGHSSIWSRSAAGFSPRPRDLPFANFYFGGFGNNWVDHQDEKRYREWYSFPGVDLNEIGGRNFLKSSVEWNLPPWRFRRAGIPAFYATWARPAIFAGVLGANVDSRRARRVAANAGGQVDFRFGTLSALELTLSIGGAVAFERDRPARHEAMISLKILK
jgi:hypothetical protein